MNKFNFWGVTNFLPGQYQLITKEKIIIIKEKFIMDIVKMVIQYLSINNHTNE